MSFYGDRLGQAYRDTMTVQGPNGPEQRQYDLVKYGDGMFRQEPDYDSETEAVQYTIDGKVYIIIKIK